MTEKELYKMIIDLAGTLKEALNTLDEVIEKKDREFVKALTSLANKLEKTAKMPGRKGDPGPRGNPGPKGDPGLPGKDAVLDIKEIVTAVKPSTVYMPDTPEQIRDKLQGLQGEMRLAASAIGGLKELVRRYAALSTPASISYLRGGLNIVHNETPTGTVNGTNRVFTLANAPAPAVTLKLYSNGSRQQAGGGDFTLSDRTITFVNAPLLNSILLADYEYS